MQIALFILMFLINESFVVYPTALPVLDEPVNNVEEILFPEELRNIKELDDLFLTSEKFQLEKLNSIKTLNKPFFYVDGNVAAKRQSKLLPSCFNKLCNMGRKRSNGWNHVIDKNYFAS